MLPSLWSETVKTAMLEALQIENRIRRARSESGSQIGTDHFTDYLRAFGVQKLEYKPCRIS